LTSVSARPTSVIVKRYVHRAAHYTKRRAVTARIAL
jgi:hypothetical protein